MFGESGKGGKGPPHSVGAPASVSLRSHPSRSELWRSAYSRRGSRAVLLNELRLQGGIACAAQLLVTAILPSVLYAQFYSLDGRLLPIPITTWVSSSLTCFLGVAGLVLLRSQLLGLHVALALALGAALGAYHTGTYILMKDRCDRVQASFLGCSASASSCACAASSSCNREALRSPACAGCQAWPTDVCSKVTGVLPYTGLIMLVFMAAPAVYSLLVLMRLEKSHSDLASRVAYARAMVLRELDRLQSGGGLGLEPRVLSHLMATLLRHGGRADEGPVREVCRLLQLEPRGLEVEWHDVEAAGGGGSRGRLASSTVAQSLAAGSSYFSGRGGEISAATAATAPPAPPPLPPPSAAAATAAARASGGAAPPVSTNSHPGPPPGAPAAAAAVAPAAAAGTVTPARPAPAAAPAPAPVRAWSPQQTALQTAVAASTGPEPGSGLRTGSAAVAAGAAAAAAMASPPVGLSTPPPLALAAGGSSTRQRSIVWQKLNMSPLDPGPGPEGPPGAGEISAAASRRGSVVLGSSGAGASGAGASGAGASGAGASGAGASGAGASGAGSLAAGPAASDPQAASAHPGLRGSSATTTNAWRDSDGGAPAAVGAAAAAEVEASRPPTVEGGDAPGDRPPPGGAAAAAAPQSGEALKLSGWQPARRGSGAWGEVAVAGVGPRLSSTAAVSRKSHQVAAAAEEAEAGPGSGSGFGLGGSGYDNAALGTAAAAAAEAAETTPVVALAPLPRPGGAPGEVEAQLDVPPQAGMVGELETDRTAVHHFKTPKSLSRARTKKQLM